MVQDFPTISFNKNESIEMPFRESFPGPLIPRYPLDDGWMSSNTDGRATHAHVLLQDMLQTRRGSQSYHQE